MKRLFATVLGCVTLSVTTMPGFAQALPQQEQRHRMPIPDKFSNLKVLPNDISKADLVSTMGMFSRSLGVRCGFCHEFKDDKPDFASDEKDEKMAARNMMRMVHDINTNYMPKLEPLPGEEKEQPGVNCWTCHRGQKEPAEGPVAEEYHDGSPAQDPEHENESSH